MFELKKYISNINLGKNADSNLFFQPKLSVDQTNDVYEQEADAVANKIISSPETSSVNLQLKENSEHITSASLQTENYLDALSGGKPLGNEKSFFESRMNYDFSNVRIHTNDAANQSAKNENALAYANGNNIVFREGLYQPNTNEGKKLLAHELTHVAQQSKNSSAKIQAKRELDNVTEKDQYSKCLAAIENVITTLETNVTKTGMPDDIKEAVKLLRKKFTEGKIKCYYLDRNAHGLTNFTTGEIYMDAKTLDGSPDIFANIGEGNVLHEGIHALHNEKYPVSTKKYGKTLDDKEAGKQNSLSKAEEKYLQKLDAWTEYWAYRKMQEYSNVKNSSGKSDDDIHSATLKDMRQRHAILPLNVVWAFEPTWDPRKWKPNN